MHRCELKEVLGFVHFEVWQHTFYQNECIHVNTISFILFIPV